MDRKMMIGAILMIAIILFASIVVMGSYFIEGKRVEVKGNFSNILTGWDVNHNECVISDDGLFDIEFWFMPWETGLIKIQAQISGIQGTYTGETWFTPKNIVYTNEPFTVTIHYVPEGSYSGTINVYEYTTLDGELKASTDFSVTVS